MSGQSSSSATAVQFLYQVVYALWGLSYLPEARTEMVTSKVGVVTKLVEILRGVQKEKVVRVAWAGLRKLLVADTAASDMVAAGIIKVLVGLQQRKMADEDIPEDVEYMYNTLQASMATMSSFDVYKKELMGGKLEWSPSHKSENFWKDNHKAFEAENCAAIKTLVALLVPESDAQTLAVACHDIGEFVKHHPEGRRLMTQFGAKLAVMSILKHSDPEVQKHALTAVQRLMVINWDLLAVGK